MILTEPVNFVYTAMRGGGNIFSKFTNLKPEKQERILNSIMKEFSQNGFKNASTDIIAKEAEISKGALFHYFKSKKDMYLFVYDYAIALLKDEIFKKLDLEEGDIFARRMQASRLKIEIMKKHPEFYDFTKSAYLEDSNEVKTDLGKRNNDFIDNSIRLLYEGIDRSKFREGIDTNMAIDIINWTLEGFGNREILKLKDVPMEEVDFEKLFSKSEEYMKLLKKVFYVD